MITAVLWVLALPVGGIIWAYRRTDPAATVALLCDVHPYPEGRHAHDPTA